MTTLDRASGSNLTITAQLLGAVAGLLHCANLCKGGPGIRSISTASPTYALDYVPNIACFSEFLGTALLVISVFSLTDESNGSPPKGLVPLGIFCAFLRGRFAWDGDVVCSESFRLFPHEHHEDSISEEVVSTEARNLGPLIALKQDTTKMSYGTICINTSYGFQRWNLLVVESSEGSSMTH